VGKLLQLLARPNMDTPDDVGYLGFGLFFAHTSLFWLLNPKPEAQAKAGENPPHHALKNVACGGFKRQNGVLKPFARNGSKQCQMIANALDFFHEVTSVCKTAGNEL
jgi:hypothetical protein